MHSRVETVRCQWCQRLLLVRYDRVGCPEFCSLLEHQPDYEHWHEQCFPEEHDCYPRVLSWVSAANAGSTVQHGDDQRRRSDTPECPSDHDDPEVASISSESVERDAPDGLG